MALGGEGESNRAIEGVRDHWCCVNAFIFTATRQVPNQNKFIIFVGPPTALIHTQHFNPALVPPHIWYSKYLELMKLKLT